MRHEGENMIGFYDYTVVLTYMSLLSAVSGIALAANRHPIIATFCLLFCGLCDMFDGRVARTKINRTSDEKSFGIQIDSLSDLVAFGVLPAMLTSPSAVSAGMPMSFPRCSCLPG